MGWRSDLLKVSGQPIHHDIEGIVEGVVVDDNGPDGGVQQHSSPGHSTAPELGSGGPSHLLQSRA